MVPLLDLFGANAIQRCERKCYHVADGIGKTPYESIGTISNSDCKRLIDTDEFVLQWLIKHTPREKLNRRVLDAVFRAAVKYNRTKAVSILLRGGFIDNETLARYGYQALAVASEKGNISIVGHLLARKVSPNGPDLVYGIRDHVSMPLLLAGRNMNVYVMMQLIRAGAVFPEKKYWDRGVRIETALILFVAGVGDFFKQASYGWVERARFSNDVYNWHPRIDRPKLINLVAALALRDREGLSKQAQSDMSLFMLAVVYKRVMEVCVALYELDLPALILCEIVQGLLAPTWKLVPFHIYWNVVVAVKHFRD